MKCLVFFLILINIGLFGCATKLSPEGMVIKDADLNLVSNCEFVGSVSGTSGWGNLASSTGIYNAKNEAREQAAKLHASHIVWQNIAGGYSPNVSGNAYACI